ncbi:hypothetical protein ACSSV1_004885 [Labrenzia sp. MBR-25]
MTQPTDFTALQNDFGGPLRHERPDPPSLQSVIILLLAILSALMLGVSVWNLSADNPGAGTNLKIVLITCSAGLVAYMVNRFSIEKGAPLAALGFRMAGLISVGAILIVGAGMYLATFSGLIIKDIEYLRLERHGAALVEYAGARNKDSLASGRAGPAIRLVAADLNANAACEIRSSCISGTGDGGHGPVARLMEQLAARAQAIADQFDQGEAVREAALRSINQLAGEFQQRLNSDERNSAQRRNDLQLIHGKIGQGADALGEAVPVSLLKAYAEELKQGVSVPGNAQATSKLNAILRQHGTALSEILEGLGTDGAVLPEFPRKPGVADTLSYLSQFASIALVVLVTELVLPLTLWVFAYLKLYWKIETLGGMANENPPKPDPWDDNFAVHIPRQITNVRPPATTANRRGPGRPKKAR